MQALLYFLSLLGCMQPVLHHKDIPNLHAILGVAEDATDREIRRAYFRLAKSEHPDKQLGSFVAHENFKRIKEAYETLTNPEKKAQYEEDQIPDIIYVWACACYDERFFD